MKICDVVCTHTMAERWLIIGIEPTPPPQQDSNVRVANELENGDTQHRDIVRADEKVEEDLENLPKLSSLKSRFEQKDEEEALLPKQERKTPPRKWERPSEQQAEPEEVNHINGDLESEHEPEVYRETHEKEEVRFTEMRSVRSRFENAEAPASGPDRSSARTPSPGATQKQFTPSRWDKNRDVPPPVNRRDSGSSEELLEVDLPPQGVTQANRNRFQSNNQEDDYNDRKPVRKITPPREEVRQDIEEFRQQANRDTSPERDPEVVVSGKEFVREEELPPAKITKSMLGVWKSMEDVNAAAPTPGRTPSQKKSSHPKQAHLARFSPDSGISDSETQMAVMEAEPQVHAEMEETNQGEVVKEEDKNEEEELPQQGITRNLLAQWRNIENKPQEEAPKPKKTQSRFTVASHGFSREAPRESETVVSQDTPDFQSQAVQDSQYTEETVERDPEVITESDNFEEEYKPPAGITKNMFAKFQNLESESQQNPVPQGGKKKITE